MIVSNNEIRLMPTSVLKDILRMYECTDDDHEDKNSTNHYNYQIKNGQDGAKPQETVPE